MDTTSVEPITTVTTVIEESVPSTSNGITVSLRSAAPDQTDNRNNKKVSFTEETVDNENLNKKKSKCCCIFEKQRLFGESSSDDDDCPDHCHGRKRFHKKQPKKPLNNGPDSGPSNNPPGKDP